MQLVLCLFYLQAVCTKCGVDTFNCHKQPLWLCKICSENREVRSHMVCSLPHSPILPSLPPSPPPPSVQTLHVFHVLLTNKIGMRTAEFNIQSFTNISLNTRKKAFVKISKFTVLRNEKFEQDSVFRNKASKTDK